MRKVAAQESKWELSKLINNVEAHHELSFIPREDDNRIFFNKHSTFPRAYAQ